MAASSPSSPSSRSTPTCSATTTRTFRSSCRGFEHYIVPTDISTCTAVSEVVNLPTGINQGFELESRWFPTQDLAFTLNYGYLDAHIKDGLTADGLNFQDTNDPAALLPTAHRFKMITCDCGDRRYIDLSERGREPRWRHRRRQDRQSDRPADSAAPMDAEHLRKRAAERAAPQDRGQRQLHLPPAEGQSDGLVQLHLAVERLLAAGRVRRKGQPGSKPTNSVGRRATSSARRKATIRSSCSATTSSTRRPTSRAASTRRGSGTTPAQAAACLAANPITGGACAQTPGLPIPPTCCCRRGPSGSSS